ncbi:hypothetical protein B0H34DRAFT_690821 [Crassisporium funariophilum]|nr:hypothetical protein B0H34DRAFT_690821 [Crassisporium funariophilum]
MDMGYECVSPHEDLDNCGGCVSLDQGVSCTDQPGVKATECHRGVCINRKSLPPSEDKWLIMRCSSFLPFRIFFG